MYAGHYTGTSQGRKVHFDHIAMSNVDEALDLNTQS